MLSQFPPRFVKGFLASCLIAWCCACALGTLAASSDLSDPTQGPFLLIALFSAAPVAYGYVHSALVMEFEKLPFLTTVAAINGAVALAGGVFGWVGADVALSAIGHGNIFAPQLP